jgi:hypothetical protein
MAAIAPEQAPAREGRAEDAGIDGGGKEMDEDYDGFLDRAAKRPLKKRKECGFLL